MCIGLILTVNQVKQNIFVDIYRTVMWGIAKGILWLLDGFFDIINQIWRFDFFNNEYVNKIFSGALIVAISWLIMKVIIELIINHIVKNDSKSSPLVIYRGIILAIVMMFLVAPLFNFGHNFSTYLTDDIIAVSNMDDGSKAESSLSKAILKAMVYTDETKEEDISELINNWKTIDINKTDGGFIGIGAVYKYSLNFFMLIVLAIVTVFLLFFVAIQMAKRVMEIAFYKIIGPFCCTSLTNSEKSFELWCKNSLGLFLITVVQFVSIGLMLNMFGTAFQNNNNMIGIFLVIGSLLFIISTPSLISSMLNQQSGMMSAFGDMQSLMAVGHGITQGLGIAKAGTMGALSLGSRVIGKGKNFVSGGSDKISNMLNRNSQLTQEQMGTLRSSLSQQNIYRAGQQVKQFSQNSSVKCDNGNIMNNRQNLFSSQSDLYYNPIRNQYFSHDSLKSRNDLDGGK